MCVCVLALMCDSSQIDRESEMQLFHTRRARDRSDSEITRTAASRANPMIFDDAVVYWNGNFQIRCSFKIGVSLSVTRRSAWLDTEVFVSRRHRGRSVGLLGDGNGDQANDLRNRAGNMIVTGSSSRTVYNHMLNCKSKLSLICLRQSKLLFCHNIK